MEKIFTQKKYRSKGTAVGEIIYSRIRSGIYPPGSKLPSCRKLAEEFSISKMTASSILRKLAEHGMVRSCGIHGIYVPEPPDGPLNIKKVIMCLPDIDGVFAPMFCSLGKQILGSHWATAVEIIDLPREAGQLQQKMLDPDNFFLFFHYPPELYTDFDSLFPIPGIKRRCAVFSVRCERSGISCFTGDELEIMRESFKYLESVGCSSIAMTGSSSNSLEADRLAALRRKYPQDWNMRILNFSGLCCNEDIAERWKKISEETLDKFDGVICSDPLMAFIGRKVLLELGRDLTKLRLLSIGNTFFLRSGPPGIAAVDPNLKGHFTSLAELIREREQGEGFEPSFYLCEPHIVPADTALF